MQLYKTTKLKEKTFHLHTVSLIRRTESKKKLHIQNRAKIRYKYFYTAIVST